MFERVAEALSTVIEFRRKQELKPFDPTSMIGAPVFYRVPTSQGWRVLEGTITRVNPTAIVVKEKFFGGKSTINPNWIVSYIWGNSAATA